MKMTQAAARFMTALGMTAVALAGCGGGGGGEPGDQNGEVQLTESAATVTEFSDAPRPAPAEAVTSLSAATVAARSLQVGADWLADELPRTDGGANVAVVLPLAKSMLHSLGRAARGETLAQIQSFLASPGTAALIELPLPSVERRLWAQSGHPFFRSFLQDTHYAAPGQALRQWSAVEMDLWAMKDDPLHELTGLEREGEVSGYDRARLAQVDTFQLSLPLAGADAVDVVWRGGYVSSSAIVRAVRLTEGVTSISTTQYRAALAVVGDYRLIQLTPHDGSLAGLSSAWVSEAVSHTLSSVDAGQGEAGALFLVRSELTGTVNRLTQGLTLPFNSATADFRGLDAQGGTYVRMYRPRVKVEVTPQSLELSAQQGLTHWYSPRNVNQGSQTGGGWGQVHSGIRPLCSGLPEVKPSLLVLLDARNQVLTLLGQREAGGYPCEG